MRIDDAENDVGAEPMPGHTCAISAEGVGIREIGIAALLQQVPLRIGEKCLRQRVRLLGRESISLGPYRLQCSMQTPDRWRIYTEMNIGSASLASNGKVIVNVMQQMSAHSQRE
jgi:hypothetical protein